jgi:hypothetical protein
VRRFGEHPLRGDQEAEHLILERRALRLAVGLGVAQRSARRSRIRCSAS